MTICSDIVQEELAEESCNLSAIGHKMPDTIAYFANFCLQLDKSGIDLGKKVLACARGHQNFLKYLGSIFSLKFP